MEGPVKSKKRRHRVGLRFKFIMGIIIIGVIIAATTLFVGGNIYWNSIVTRYTDTAYKIADTAVQIMGESTVAEYAERVQDYMEGYLDEDALVQMTDNDHYRDVKNNINSLRKSMNANDVFLCVLDYDILTNYDAELDAKDEWLPLCYIMDCYYEPDMDFTIGGRSPILTEYIDILIEAIKTGEHPTEFIVSNTENYGYITTAVQPIVVDGKTVAFCFVEIPMSTLESDAAAFIVRSSTAAGIVTVVVLIIAITLLVLTMIRPIVFVAGEAERFTENNEIISDKLDKIKTHDEIQTLSENLLKLEIGINEYIDNLTRVTAEKERIGAELNVAAKIQADMLPCIFPAYPANKEFDLYASMNPAKEVGGDFYDFFMVDDSHLALVMADVSGKGVPAALFMVIAKTLIKNRTQMGGTPAEILKDVNEQLCEGNEAGLFVTVWLAILDIRTGKGIAANAGHEHPALKRSGGDFELVIYRHSPAVATFDMMKFREHEFELLPGDRLFVYTDGVPEAMNGDKVLFGTDRMLKALKKYSDADAKELLLGVKREIDSFVGDAEQFDDVTMLCLDYFGTQGE